MDLHRLGKWLIVAGAVLGFAGLLVLAAAALGIPLGRLPGDWSWRRGNLRVWVPIGTSILVSVVLTVVLNVLARK